MKYKILKTLLLCLALLGGYACERDDINGRETLSVLSEDLITLDTTGTAVAVSVQSSRADWGYIKTAEWLLVSRTDQGLSLSADANVSSQVRRAELIIVAGSAQRKVVVEQAASLASVKTQETHKQLDFKGGVLLFDINTNIPDWRVTTDVDWLSTRIIRQTSQVEVTVAKSQDRNQRDAKLYIVDSSGNVGAELSVTQLGMPYHLLPHWGFLGGDLEIRNFEFARGSSLTMLPDGFFNYYIWRFSTVSDAFRYVNYTIVRDQYIACDVYATNTSLFSDLSELEDQRKFLTENGFEKLKENVYYNPTQEVRAKIIVGKGYDRVNYLFHPKQSQPQPTIPEIPSQFSSLSATLDEITAWETANGGVLSTSKSSIKTLETETSLYWFDVDGRDDIIARFYYIPNKTKVVSEYAVCYSNIERIYQKYQTDIFYSNEFMDLLEQQGFENHAPQGNNKKKYSYKHYQPDGNYYIVSQYVKYRSLPVSVAELRFIKE